MPRAHATFRHRLLPLVAAAFALALAGCGDDSRKSYATEADEPYFRQAEQMKRANRQQEALSAYLRVIERRGDDAPESHLEAGLVYLHHIRDPIAAIYHFRKYLALRPNSAQAPLVRQRIDAAIREFARTLPAQPLETQLQRVDLIAAMDKLKLENDILKRQVADLQAGREPAADETTEPGAERATTPASRPPSTAPKGGEFAINLDTMPTVRTRPARAEPPAQPRTAPANTSAKQTAPANSASKQTTPANSRAGGRLHVVQGGDTLSKIAQKYYGSRARWKDILQANRATMKNENDLHVGQQITIPP